MPICFPESMYELTFLQPAENFTHLTACGRTQIRNLEESIAIPLLKNTLQSIFAQYGKIIDIVAKKNLRAKGQAFVVFDTLEAAEKAIREVQGFSLFEKPMVLQFARTKSDATVRVTGTEEELQAHQRRRVAEKGRLLGCCEVNSVRQLECGKKKQDVGDISAPFLHFAFKLRLMRCDILTLLVLLTCVS